MSSSQDIVQASLNSGHLLSKTPWGLKWRSSVWFVTFVIGFGIATDLTVYSVIIPVVPFQLEHLGYHSVSALTAWLLCAFSLGLVFSTPPISWLSERYNSRRYPLLLGLTALMASMVLFMEAPNYAVMVLARAIQGISSSTVWIVGLALLCDTVPEGKVGQQLGLASMGLTIGLLGAPPIGGALYGRFGFRAPFIFGIIIAMLDLIGRLLIVERKDALKWGIDPLADCPGNNTTQASANPGDVEKQDACIGSREKKESEVDAALAASGSADRPVEGAVTSTSQVASPAGAPRLSSMKVLKMLIKSKRTSAALVTVIIYGLAFTGFEPTLPLRLQDVYSFNSSKVGLIYLACAAPSIITSPLSGWIADRHGVEWITAACFVLCIPFYLLLIIRGHLALFIVALIMLNVFISGVISPLMTELASLTRSMDGVGYAHVYGAFNLAFGIGSTLGPIMAGQIYDHTPNGWVTVCCVGAGLVFLATLLSIAFIGEHPIRLMRRKRKRGRHEDEVA